VCVFLRLLLFLSCVCRFRFSPYSLLRAPPVFLFSSLQVSSRCIIYSRCITLPFPFVPTSFFEGEEEELHQYFIPGFFFYFGFLCRTGVVKRGEGETRNRMQIDRRNSIAIQIYVSPPGGGGTNKSGQPFLAAT
jgi:hypothetical protein